MKQPAPGTATLALPAALMMFPQVVETIYSPALASIAQGFAVERTTAGQTMSVYFVAFALGTWLFGGLADRIGRRPSMLAGLALYVLGCVLALRAMSFEWLLLARAVSAVGASVGSIVTQTWIRDRYSGGHLAKAYAVLGMALALSPALGLLVGSVLVAHGGHVSVFAARVCYGAALLLWAWMGMQEPAHAAQRTRASRPVLRRMLADRRVQLVAAQVALYNWLLFAFYQLAPFHLAQWGHNVATLAYSSIALCTGAAAGAGLNRYWLERGCTPQGIVDASAPLLLLGSVAMAGLVVLQSPAFLAAMALVSMAYGLAIPNVLAEALHDYADCRGSAGALLGAAYYGLLALLLALSAALHDLALVMCVAWLGLQCVQWLLRSHRLGTAVEP